MLRDQHTLIGVQFLGMLYLYHIGGGRQFPVHIIATEGLQN